MAYTAKKTTKHGKPCWVVDVKRGEEGRRMRIFGPSKSEAEYRASQKLGEIDAYGERKGKLKEEERAFIVRWVDGKKVTLEWMEETLSKALEGIKSPKMVQDAANEYLTAPRETELSVRHTGDMKYRLRAFVTAFSERTLESIRPGELEVYIRSKGPSAPNYYRVLRGLLNHAVRHEWIAANPLAKIRRPDVPPQEKEAFTPEQMMDALKLAAGIVPGLHFTKGGDPDPEPYQPMLRMLVFGGFLGLRHSELMRLDCSQVDLATGEVHVTKLKTRRTGVSERYVHMPDVARKWIEWLRLPHTGKLIEVHEPVLMKHRIRMVDLMKLEEWPRNVLRRSFGSYHLAAFQNAALTAELMGHTDADTTKSKYRVPRRKEIAEAWFALTPEKVLASAESPATSAH